MKTVLCIPDAHVEANEDLSRFDALGEFIMKTRPDYIVQLGDFNTMSSLSHWDMNKRLLMEGRRFGEDMGTGYEAVRRMTQPMRIFNERQKINKQKQYKPKTYWLRGNHEDWVIQYEEEHPEMHGLVDIEKRQGVYKFFDDVTVVPYREYVSIDGVAFTHSPIMANRQPVSGVYAIKRALELFDTSVVFGHIHRLETMTAKAHGSGMRRTSLACGCFWDTIPKYLVGAQINFWEGVVTLNITSKGQFDFATTSLKTLKGMMND